MCVFATRSKQAILEQQQQRSNRMDCTECTKKSAAIGLGTVAGNWGLSGKDSTNYPRPCVSFSFFYRVVPRCARKTPNQRGAYRIVGIPF